MMENPEESFRKAEAAHERDMGIEEGYEDFTCLYCGAKYSLRYHEEAGSNEFIDDPWCPECGWPVVEEGENFSYLEKINNEEPKAPCPICNKIVHVVIQIDDECVQLSCGHWTGEEFLDYADAYEEVLKTLGLKRTGIHDSFIKKYPKAGMNQTFDAWLEELEKVLQSRFGIGIKDIAGEGTLHQYFERGDSPNEIIDHFKRKWNLDDSSEVL